MVSFIVNETVIACRCHCCRRFERIDAKLRCGALGVCHQVNSSFYYYFELLIDHRSPIISEACDTAREENRTALTGDDIIRAAAKLGFDDYIAPLTRYLELYRAANGSLPPPRAAEAVSVSTVDDLRDDPLAPVSNEPLIVPSTDVAEFIDLPPPTFDDDDQ